MSHHFACVFVTLVLAGAGTVAYADVLAVRAGPAQAPATAGQEFTLTLNWQVTQDAADRGGVRSPGGAFFNALSGAPLGLAVPTTLESTVTGRQRLLTEQVSVDGDTLAAWYRQGIRRVGYRRPFIAVASGRAQSGQLVISLSRSTLDAARDAGPGELRVLRMELAFSSGRRIELPARDSKLTAQLTLSYAGSGILRGRWQIAEPGSASSAFFHTLGFVRQSLAPTQRTTLVSPRLPTGLGGRYALRFCLEDSTGLRSDDCADSSAGVSILYDVAPDEAAIGGLAPNGSSTGNTGVFRWRAIPGSAIYQLQIVRSVADRTDRPEDVVVPGHLRVDVPDEGRLIRTGE